MGFGDKVKDIYFSAEEKWYKLLDKIDARAPIYKVVDKVDQVVPSFALFIIVLIILLLLIGIGIFGVAGGVGGETILQLTIVDVAGNGISGAEVTLQGIDATYYSNDFGLIENIALAAGGTINVTATKGDKTKSKQIYLNANPKVEEIQIPVDQISFDSMTVLFLTETGQRINDRLNLSYRCTSGSGTPADDTIYDGSANINVSSACGVLSATITSDKYETATKTITQSSTTFYLVEKVPAQMVTMSVQLTSNGSLISEPVTVKAFRMNNLYLPEDTVISANGSANFTLQEGNYKFSTITEQGYLTNSISNVSITTGMSPVVIDLTKSVIGKIKITTKRGSTQLDEVFITLLKNTIEVHTGDTNEDGEIEFEVAETGPYTAIATKEGYCSEIQTDIDVGDDVDIAMKMDTGSCGGTLSVKVLDQDNRAVQYARAIIFGEKDIDSYKLGYADKLTDYNGEAEWEPVKYSTTGEKYRVFAFKGSYTGWSTLKEFTALNQGDVFTVNLDIPLGSINVIVKDKDGDPITFTDQEPVYVQLYEDFGNNPISGKKIIEDSSGLISFVTKAGRRVYAVVEKAGYQSHMTLPKEVIGDGTVTFEVTLYRPPIDELYVNYVGLYKNGSQVLKVEPGQEYDALFELVAPKDYEELGVFVRVGRDDYTKTEFDKIYIKDIIAPGAKDIMKGATYTPPKGYSTDETYLNQDESKWAQVIWNRNDFVQGRIMVSAKVKIRDNAQVEEQLTISYRAWGVLDGSYERDIQDDVLGTSASNSTKQELYAATKEAYATVGMETLCEESGERAFCITSTYTDPDGITSSFDTTFDAKNSSEYSLFIKVMNASNIGFDIAKTKIENDEENLRLGSYSLYTPTNEFKSGNINGNTSDWIETNNYAKNSSITFNELKVTPTATGYGSLKLRIRDASTILFEKTFGVNISSNKKIKAEYMYNSTFQSEIPNIASGKVQTLTIKAKNNANGLEIDNAMVKLYDRFGTKLAEKQTNSLGTTSITIPASLPGEKLTIKIEKADYETFVQDFTISEDIVEVTPTTLGFTVNPQTKTEETKTIKIENKTGFDLKIKEIILDGKFKGKLNEAQIESWLYNYAGTTIASDDYEEINLKIISATNVIASDDLTGTFQITVTNGYTEWVKEVKATIRVGLGKDADDPNCLEITQNNWKDSTQGEQISIGFEVMNNCVVDGTPIPLKNLAAKDAGTGNILGTLSVQSDNAYSEIVRGFARTFQPIVDESETVPITLSFVPDGGVNGQTTGTIIFQAINETDSKDQVLQTSIAYTIDAINLDECITLGADLIRMTEEESGSFSVTNNCPTSIYFEVDTELMTSDDKFTLTSGETKEVSLTGAENDVGAFNTLVYAREGSNAIELIDNVKTIIDPAGGCFSLSRYEFDIYDAPDDDYDGTDIATLKNSCTEKNVTAQIQGKEEYNYDNLIQSAILGALAGFVGSDFTLYKDTSSKQMHDNKDNITENIGTARTRLKTNYRNYASAYTGAMGDQLALGQGIIALQRRQIQRDFDSAVVSAEQQRQADLSRVQTCQNSENLILKAELENQRYIDRLIAEYRGNAQGLANLNDQLSQAMQEFTEEAVRARNDIDADLDQSIVTMLERAKRGNYSQAQVNRDLNSLQTRLNRELTQRLSRAKDKFVERVQTILERVLTVELTAPPLAEPVGGCEVDPNAPAHTPGGLTVEQFIIAYNNSIGTLNLNRNPIGASDVTTYSTGFLVKDEPTTSQLSETRTGWIYRENQKIWSTGDRTYTYNLATQTFEIQIITDNTPPTSTITAIEPIPLDECPRVQRETMKTPTTIQTNAFRIREEVSPNEPSSYSVWGTNNCSAPLGNGIPFSSIPDVKQAIAAVVAAREEAVIETDGDPWAWPHASDSRPKTEYPIGSGYQYQLSGAYNAVIGSNAPSIEYRVDIYNPNGTRLNTITANNEDELIEQATRSTLPPGAIEYPPSSGFHYILKTVDQDNLEMMARAYNSWGDLIFQLDDSIVLEDLLSQPNEDSLDAEDRIITWLDGWTAQTRETAEALIEEQEDQPVPNPEPDVLAVPGQTANESTIYTPDGLTVEQFVIAYNNLMIQEGTPQRKITAQKVTATPTGFIIDTTPDGPASITRSEGCIYRPETGTWSINYGQYKYHPATQTFEIQVIAPTTTLTCEQVEAAIQNTFDDFQIAYQAGSTQCTFTRTEDGYVHTFQQLDPLNHEIWTESITNTVGIEQGQEKYRYNTTENKFDVITVGGITFGQFREAIIRLGTFGDDPMIEPVAGDNEFKVIYNGNPIYWTSAGMGKWRAGENTYHYDGGSFLQEFPVDTGNFILAAKSISESNGRTGILNNYTSQIISGFAAWNSGSALGGALMGALIELTQASDTIVDSASTFIVDYVTISEVTLASAEGIALSVGESTYDYDDFYTGTGGGAGYNITSETLATNYSLVEEQELTFTNPSGLISDTPYQPYIGILSVSASENVYDDKYEYDKIKEAAINRKEYEENDSAWYKFWDVSSVEIASMDEADLAVEEVRTIEKKFHLLFNSYEYTTTIDDEVIGNCTVGAKTGSTGPKAVPKLLFNWDWSASKINMCDETNSDYKYCDTTQMTMSMLQKIYNMREFFRTNSLGECPQAIDVSGTKTQTLSTTDLDVGITQIQANETGSGAQLELQIKTNNNLPMDVALNVKVYESGTTNVKAECDETQNVTSTATFYCNVDTATSGAGTFDVVSTITPTLCVGCENSDSANDIMTSQLIIGQTGTQDCLYYKTQKDYFEDVLAANGKLNSAQGQEMLGYLNFTINLVKDGFSKDFKEDFDDYMNSFTTKPAIYTELESLFESDKFNITWPGKPGAWEAGKYNVRIVIEFENDSWTWNDNNDIKSVDIILSGWGKPDVSHAIYNIGFNGRVGLDSNDGRVGYGAGYTQLSEDALTIVDGIDATPNPYSNALTEVNVEVDKDFYTMNTSRRGNVLTIARKGSKVDLILSPSTAVPLLLDVTRNTARDAYAYYTVEVDGEPQTTGSSLITWNGIGNGCVDFDGSGMGTWDNAPDAREASGNGYGLGGSIWTNAVASGTASFYGTFYAPDNSSTAIYFTRQSEDALFTSDQGIGDLLTIDTSSGISTLKDVFDKVANEEVCVIGGEYFWNSGKVYEPIEAEISSRTNSCMQIS